MGKCTHYNKLLDWAYIINILNSVSKHFLHEDLDYTYVVCVCVYRSIFV